MLRWWQLHDGRGERRLHPTARLLDRALIQAADGCHRLDIVRDSTSALIESSARGRMAGGCHRPQVARRSVYLAPPAMVATYRLFLAFCLQLMRGGGCKTYHTLLMTSPGTKMSQQSCRISQRCAGTSTAPAQATPATLPAVQRALAVL